MSKDFNNIFVDPPNGVEEFEVTKDNDGYYNIKITMNEPCLSPSFEKAVQWYFEKIAPKMTNVKHTLTFDAPLPKHLQSKDQKRTLMKFDVSKI
jgi:hypothetical protein